MSKSESNSRWQRSHKAVYNVAYHIIWCPSASPLASSRSREPRPTKSKWYSLLRPDVVKEDAFGDVVKQLREATEPSRVILGTC